MDESLKERVARVLRDEIEVVPYDPAWPEAFRVEEHHLRACLPPELLGRIEHYGSTSIPGLCAKPVIDLLIEVFDLAAVKERIVPILTAQGYEYFWSPTHGDDGPPFYAFFIKRHADGKRSHHLHMIEPHFEMWDNLYFRDTLRIRPDLMAEYGQLKLDLAQRYAKDRLAYCAGKEPFIQRVTAEAKEKLATR